jgi:hypothetical protein
MNLMKWVLSSLMIALILVLAIAGGLLVMNFPLNLYLDEK